MPVPLFSTSDGKAPTMPEASIEFDVLWIAEPECFALHRLPQLRM